MMRLCAVCGFPIQNPRRVRTCGQLCAKEWERIYQRQYHVDNLDDRREYRRRHQSIYSRKNAEAIRTRRRAVRKTWTAEQKEKERLRYRKYKTSRGRETERLRRQNFSPEQREKWLAAKKRYREKHAGMERIKRRERHVRNPQDRREYVKKYQQRNQLAYQLLKSFGVEIDLNTLEVTNVH